jgi:hypothetical protein
MIFLLHLFMKLKLTPLYVLSFLFLTFFVHELHDWAHTVMARLVSGGWGTRGFDSWQFESNAPVSNGQRALATLAGPVVNILLLWFGYTKMATQDSLADQSFGCSLVLATLPLGMLLAAAGGGGDLTSGLKLLSPHTEIYHPHLIAGCGLLIMLLVCIPPLVRTFIILPSWQGKFIFFPIFLILPVWLDHFLVGGLLNRLLKEYEIDEGQAYSWVIFWTAAMLGGWLLTRRRQEMLLVDRELPL